VKRREFITLLGGAAAAWPLGARGQQPERIRRIGVVTVTKETDPETPLRAMAFREALAKLGWSEGRNVVIDFRFGTGDLNRFRAEAKELTGLTLDVIVAESTPAAVALRQETAAVPIVFLQVANPIGSGLVASLARPGANLTGFTNFEPTMGGKWLELLKEIAPGVTALSPSSIPKRIPANTGTRSKQRRHLWPCSSIEPRLATPPGSRPP
jgi:putative ABC transport system substrate-binding protein